MGDADERVELPRPAILKPLELWTGKQLFSLMLRPTAASPLRVYLESRTKDYNVRRLDPEPEHMCPDDGFVCYHDSELISGVMEKSTLGGGSKSGLFAVLLRDHSAEASAQAMGRLAKLTSRFLMDHGFSIGINDVQPTARLTVEKEKLLRRGYRHCSEKTEAFEAGKLQPSPGCTPEQTLESEMNGLLSKIRDDAGDICKKELHRLNAPLTMAKCGSKGSFINISQMIACVGQQSVGGRRMPNGFVHRALPHFPRHSLEPAAKGFVGTAHAAPPTVDHSPVPHSPCFSLRSPVPMCSRPPREQPTPSTRASRPPSSSSTRWAGARGSSTPPSRRPRRATSRGG